MTTDRRFESDLSDLLAELAPRRTPDYRDDVVQQTARTRQRPAWTFPERWLPVDLTMTPMRGRIGPVAGIALLAIVGLLIVAIAAVYIGAQTRALPAPFGPAANGSLYYSAGGDIYRVDTVGGTPQAIVTGATSDAYPMPSRDGQLIAFERAVAGGRQILVGGQDGSNTRLLPGTYTELNEREWSPDGEQIAIVSTVDGDPSISILPTDGSPTRTLDVGMETHSIWYLPDGRLLFMGTTTTTTGPVYGLYVVDPAGGAPVAIAPTSTVDGTWIDPVPTPDGKSVLYHRWDDQVQGQLRVLDIASGTDTALDAPASEAAEDEGAMISPDGESVLFTRFSAADNTLAVVPRTGGDVVEIGERTPGNQMALAEFSPDGRSVLAYYPATRHLWLLDPTGNTPGQQLSLPVTDVPTWQRTAP